jgi:hypothetical protein
MAYLNTSSEIPAADKFHSSYFAIIATGLIDVNKPEILTGVGILFSAATIVNDWAIHKKSSKHAVHAG